MFLLLLPFFASSSELTGKISTKPSQHEQKTSNQEQEKKQSEDFGIIGSGGGLIMPRENIKQIKKQRGQEAVKGSEILVKGISFYPAGTLLRDSQKRIYIFNGKYKRHIKTIEELAFYVGQKIIDTSDYELSQYPSKVYLTGDLIRVIGQDKIYLVEDSKKTHIKNLQELRDNFAGQSILNLELKYL